MVKTFNSSVISTSQRVIHLPRKTERSNLQQPKLGSKNTLDLRLTTLRIGSAVFAGISGEVFTEIGMKLKEKSPFSQTFIVTHCNGSSGYFITDKAYEEGGYEARSTRVKFGAEQTIIDNMLEMIHGL
jgi:hypothetical protein